jgi:hypothetical protein
MNAPIDLLEPTVATPPLDVGAVIAQLVERIAEAPVDLEPTENIYMEQVLPPAVYQELLARMPGDAVLDPIDHPDARAPDGRITRRLIDLTDASIARFAVEDRPFWRALTEALTSRALAAAMVDKFRMTLTARFGLVLPEIVAVPLIYRDFPGYRIGIHPDSAAKIATFQLYLPADDSQRHLGTTFHLRSIWGGFERYKTNVFAPNTAYAFVRTDESWHSVDQLAPCEAPRNTLALTFYIRGGEYRSDPR